MMNSKKSSPLTCVALGCCSLIGTVMLGLPTCAVAAAKADIIQQTYLKERETCLTGRSAQDRATCLKEAGAARQEARRGTLDSRVDARQLSENALARCRAVHAEDRADCERLAMGEGHSSGSVAEGAVLKELITRRVEPPASAALP